MLGLTVGVYLMLEIINRGPSMARRVKTAEELGEALKNGEDTIEIEGSLKDTTLRIRATGKVAWAIAIAAIGIAVYAALAAIPTGGTTAVATVGFASAAAGILGLSVTTSAIAIAVAAGGVGALTSLRNYKEVERTDNLLILKRK